MASDVVTVTLPLEPVRRAALEEYERAFAGRSSYSGSGEGSARYAVRERIEAATRDILDTAGVNAQVAAAIRELLPSIIREVVGEALAKVVRAEVAQQKKGGAIADAAEAQLALGREQPAGEGGGRGI